MEHLHRSVRAVDAPTRDALGRAPRSVPGRMKTGSAHGRFAMPTELHAMMVGTPLDSNEGTIGLEIRSKKDGKCSLCLAQRPSHWQRP